jgi:hypothetical protein
MIRKIYFVITFLAFLFSVNCVSIYTQENLIFSEDEIEILNLTINYIKRIILLPENETLLINRNVARTWINLTLEASRTQQEIREFREKYLPNVGDELWQSFYSNNIQKYIFDSKTSFDVQNYKLVVNISDDFKENNIRGEHFPLISFSRIGFNNDRIEAIFEIDYYFPRAGDGFIVHLKKENNVWKIINIINTWIS